MGMLVKYITSPSPYRMIDHRTLLNGGFWSSSTDSNPKGFFTPNSPLSMAIELDLSSPKSQLQASE